jgi:glucose-6-phosphate-specific signal transduction histidine kinase
MKKIRGTPKKKKIMPGRPKTTPFPIVGIGASAGGLEAYQELLRNLSAKPGMVFVFIMHLDSHCLTFELSNPILYELGLEAAIEQWLTEHIAEKHGIKCSFNSDIRTAELNQKISIVLFQAVRELPINMAKHAKASTVEVIARKKGEMVEIAVNDNGIGLEQFDKAFNISDSKKGGFGLFSIKERIGYLGESLNIESDSQNGTRATISMPLKTIRQLQVREEPNNENINRR